MGRSGALLVVWCVIGAVRAEAAVPSAASVPEDDDSAALALTGVGSTGAAKSVSLTAEAALTEAQLPGGYDGEERVSLDFRDDVTLNSRWRAVIADRLDLDWVSAQQANGAQQVSGAQQGNDAQGLGVRGSGSLGGGAQQVNTLKQAYVTWQPRNDLLMDAGRINARQGVALGYNPTDFFKADALRAVDSLDPGSLRDERLGTVMLRGETLWDSGALTAAYAPRLAGAPSDGPFSADFGATNHQGRWLLALSQRLSHDFAPQWLVFGEQGGSPQVGLNATTVVGQATVAFVEASVGRMRSLWAESLNSPDSEAWRTRAAAGLTYSTSYKLSLSLEYEYDGAALSRAGWNSARAGDPQDYGTYRNYVASQQELPTQHNVFAYAAWQDVVIKHMDLAAFVRIDMLDHSRLPWAEVRYHWSHVDAAMRWQDYNGSPTSDFGASASGQTWQVLLDYYL